MIAAEASRPPRPRRTQPRGGELALLRSLLSGPRPLSAGPVGRCTKHGWLRVLFEREGSAAASWGSASRDPASWAVARYELTDAGRAAIGEPSWPPHQD